MKRRRTSFNKLYEGLERSEQISNMMTTYIVAHELSDVCKTLAEMTKDKHLKERLKEQEAKFRALSKLVVYWASKK